MQWCPVGDTKVGVRIEPSAKFSHLEYHEGDRFNVTVNPMKICCEAVNWIELPQDRAQWQILIKFLDPGDSRPDKSQSSS